MQLNNPAYRWRRNLAIVLVTVVVAAIVVFSAYRITHKQTKATPGVVAPASQFPSMAVAPPGGVGCYYQKPGQEAWQSVACVPPSELNKMPRPQVDPNLFPASMGSVVPGTSRATSLWQGYIGISFFTFSGETDNFYGPNLFSIQANSNFFKGLNGDTYWVQFVYTYFPPGNPTSPKLCVWQQDISLGNSSNNAAQNACVGVDAETLSSNWGAVVYGITTYDLCPLGSGCQAGYYLTAKGVTSGGSWAVTTPDVVGLSVSWSQISGSIVGVALGSKAQFTSRTLIGQTTGAFAPGLNSVSFSNQGATTAETNNLFLVGARYFPAQHDFCSGSGWCYLNTMMGN